MIDKPQYIIVAGINGAGKSTLYDTFPSLFDKTKRINADELLRQMGGDWHKDSDNLKAMKEEIKQLHYALDHQQSIHVETTLAGRGKAQLNLIDKAHKNGFEVTLLFDLPKHAGNFTPFGWIANVPVENVDQTWLIVMVVSAIVLFILGIAGYRRQDLSL